MKTYLINHLRIPGDVPHGDGLAYLDQVEATAAPFGGRWLLPQNPTSQSRRDQAAGSCNRAVEP